MTGVEKEIYPTDGVDVLTDSVQNHTSSLSSCNHEEGNTRIMVHSVTPMIK